MLSSKVLDRLLKFSDVNRDDYYFNPLLFEDVAEKVSTNLCAALTFTSVNDGSELKKKIRKSMIEMTRKLCKSTYSHNTLSSLTKYDIMLKHMFSDSNYDSGYVSRYNRQNYEIYNVLSSYRYENLSICIDSRNSVALCDIELGIALTNIESDISIKSLKYIVEKCLNFNKEIDKPMLEFLEKVWKNNVLILPENLYDFLTVKLLFLFKRDVKNILSVLNENYNEIQNEDLTNYEPAVDSLLYESFPNFHILLNRLAHSSHVFCAIFKSLSQIFIESNSKHIVEIFIHLLLKKVKSESKSYNILHLYPLHLNSIILFLENDPDDLKNVKMLYTYVLNLINNLHNNSGDFTFLLTHYKKWLQHYSIYYNLQELM